MKKSTIVKLAVTGVLLLTLLWVMGSYNGLVTKSEAVDNQWSQVETQYQRRFDLVPNLVNATKGILTQEQKIFGDIAEARTRYAGAPSGSNERVQAAAQFESALGRLLVIIENYPQLRSVETVRALTDELAGTENRVLVSRDRYNEQVRDYNVTIKRFPRNVIAAIFGYDEREFFQSVDEASQAPKVDLSL